MERVLSHARDAGAKVVLVGDPEQLQAIEAGAAFRSISERHGAAEITEVRRQREDWQKEATRSLATGRTGEALDAYAAHGMVYAANTREQARGELVDGWDRQRRADPDQSRIILTHISTLSERMNVLAERPGISITPEGIARQVAAAAGTVRAEDQPTIAAAGRSLEDATRALHGYVVSARRGDEQNRWLAWTAIGATAFGILLWAAFAGAVARAVPEGWLWPERMAARTLRLDPWDASRRLAGVSRPETWNTMVRGAIVTQDNEAAIKRCRRAATKAREAVPCTVRIAADPRVE